MQPIPLSMIAPGQIVKLVAINCNKKTRKRLADLGLNIGMSLQIMQGSAGSIILAIKNDARLALGRGIAHHILVTEEVQ